MTTYRIEPWHNPNEGREIINAALASLTGSTGGVLEGTQYVYVSGNGTPSQNGVELKKAYEKAVTMNPNATNPIEILIGPGSYTLPETLTLNTSYVNLVSLTGQRDVVISGNTIFIDNNVVTYVCGINSVQNSGINFSTLHANTKIHNCQSQDNSFGYDSKVDVTINGEIKNCVATNNSFGYTVNNKVIIYGNFESCVSGNNSFGSSDIGSVTMVSTLKSCTAGNNSFGSSNTGVVSATCIADNCVSGENSFGYSNSGKEVFLGGLFSFCKSTQTSFGYSLGFPITVSANFNFCESGENSFGGGGKAVITSTINHCVSGSESFGFGDGQPSAVLYFCRLSAGIYQTPVGNGRIRACIDGSNVFYIAVDPI